MKAEETAPIDQTAVEVAQETQKMEEVAPMVEPAYTEEEIADAQAFVKASSTNTTEAYQEYLDNYPEGAYRNGARGGIWMIEGTNPETHGEVVDARNAAMEVLKSVDESKPTGEVVSPVDEKQPLRDRAQEWTAKTGIPVMLIETEAEVTNEDARKALKEGRDVTGWFEAKSGAVALYMPHLHSAKDVDLTYIHEVVAHKGLRALMGDKFDALCDKVWESMSEDARSRFLDYVGEKFNSELERQRAAADEYMAFIAEGVDLTEADKTVWDKIVEFFREFVESFGTKLTDAEIETLIKASYANLKNMQEKSSGDTVENGYRERRTFHGSGAQFDKFDHSFMGSGEGAQAFGWGTYVTEVEGIGRSYAGVGVTKLGPLQAKLGNIDSAINSLEKEVQKAEKDLTSDNETARRIATYLLETADEKRKALEEEKAAVEDEIKSYRNLYTVEIPDDNGSNYLHWDERIPMNVVNSIKKRLFDVLAEGDYKGVEKELKRELDDVFKADNNDGNLIYGNISAYLGGDKAASLFLNDMGFVGISYPAEAMTGGRADGARNYVIFNENDAQIESRTMFRIAKTPQEFDAIQKEAVEKRGIVAPNLNSAVVNVVDVPRHDFTGTGSEAISKAKQWAKDNLVGEYIAKKGTNDEFNYSIDEKSIKKYLSGVSTGLSDNLGVHLSVLKMLPDVINESIEVEIHADYKKGEGRSVDNGIDDENLLIHRLYGAAYINGDLHRIKTTLKERRADGVKPYTYEVTKIELLGGSSHKGTSSSDAPNNSIPATKLLNGVEKSYDKGKFVLKESENFSTEVNPQDSEGGIRFRKAQALENFKLTQDNQWDFSLAIRNSIAPGWSDYARVGDMEIRVKEHTPNWDRFEDPETGEARAKKILNVTVGDYNNTNYRRYKGEYEEFVENHPEVVAVDVEIEDGAYLGDALEKIHKALQEKGIDFEFTSDDAWVEQYSEENNDLSNRTYFRVANENQEIFVSNAKKAVEEIKQEKATPQQWLAMIKKNGGLKAGEDKWMGLSEWLENNESKSLTKQEVLDFVNENAIKIEEVRYSQFGYGMMDEAAKKLEAETKEIGWDAMQEKYPGIEEYFEYYNGEVLWNTTMASIGEYEDFVLDNKIVYANPADNAINESRESYTTEGLERKREIALVVPTVEPYNQHDEIHFGDAGNGRAVAWVRFGETTDSEGNRVLVIDEIQSKRHQDGREKGYKPKGVKNIQWRLEEIAERLNELGRIENASDFGLTDSQLDEQARLLAEEKELMRSGTVPAAPFEKNWQELAMKRMLRLAAEEGFDKVAWTTGEQQAERYNMSREVERIVSNDNDVEQFSDGKAVVKDVVINTAGAGEIRVKADAEGNIHGGEFDGKNLAELVGKELAVKLMQPGNIELKGEGMKVGGEGMKGFYDKMLPSFVSKYTKKWGAKVGEVEMPSLEQNNVMHSVDVTPEMKESVMEGQTMFRFTDADRQAMDFRRTHRGSANIVVIDADMMTAGLLAQGFNAEEIVKIRELHKKGSVGFYSIDRNTIYLLGKNLGREENEGTFWHENTHKAIVDLDVPQEILDEFYSMPSEEFIKKFEELAIKGYTPEDYPEEFMAYYIEHVRDSGRHERSIEIMGVAPEKVERVAQIVEPIINYINYGRRRVDTGTERVSKESGNLRDSGVETLPRGEKEGTRLRDTRFSERESIDDIPTQPLTLVERVKNSLLEAAAKNKENLQLRADALRTYGRDVANVLKLMGKQREYDKSTVDTLMKLVKMYFKHAQLLGELSAHDVSRIMSLTRNIVGKRDVTNEATKLMDILLDAHAKALDGILEKAEKIKAKKVNAAGVEVMGSLDKYAQETIGTYRDSKGWDQQVLDESIIDSANRLAEAEDMVRKALGLSPVDDVDAALDGYVPATPAAENAIEVYKMERARFEGFDLAREYRENVHHYKTEISQLNQELKDAGLEVKKGNIDRRAYNELKRSIEDAIMQSKAEMIDGYHGVISRFTEDVRGGRARAKQFVQEQVDRARDIQHNANSDMEGNPANVQGTHPDKWNGSVPRLFMSAMPTFQNMLKKFGEKAVDGKGYLYTRFMPQATQAADKEFRGKVSARLLIEAKLEGIYDKKMSIEKFMNLSRKHGVTISYKEGGVEKSFDLNKGQMLYIYMVNKMTDGQMKLRKMGITEELVADIAERLDPEMVRFADWAQNELLTDLRGKYNEVHERMFGAPMASIDNYFPLKIKKEARGEKVDNGRQDAEEKPSTVTGSIIKRTKNATAIDLSADAMSVLIEHIDNMEHWAAFAEFNRDLNTLLNYRHFQNQVKGMTTIRYGSGDVLWKNFQKVAAIASGEYRPKTSEVDKAVMNIAKGITRSKINFRTYTAVKQLLSAPAFWNEAGFMELMKTYRNPWGSFKWAKENLPGFKERWEGRTMGNEKLMPDESDWKVWRNKFVENATKWGMTPNAAIDAMTVAQGARAVYLTKLQQLKKAGFSHEQANAMALQAAAEAYNESQQSSEGAYLAPIQKDGTVASAILTTFKNSNFGYTRKTAQAVSNILRKMHKGYKEETIAFMAKKLEREGLTPEQAKAYAKKIYKKSKYKDVVDVAMFGFGLNILWELGGIAIYLMAGDDDETKEKMREEAALRGALGVLNGIPGGETIASGAMAVAAGDANLFRLPELVAVGDVRNLVKVLDTDMVKGVTDLINLLTAAGIGVNPQVITDLFVAIDDFDSEEFGMFVLRAMAAPTSQTEQLEVDKAMEDNGKRLEEIAAQYVEYKKKRQTPLTGWMYTDEGEQKAMDRYAGRFDKMLDERLEKVVEDTDEYQEMYEHSNPYMKEKLSKMRKAYLEGDKEVTFEKLETAEVVNRRLFGENYKDTNVGYFNLSTSEDEDAAYLIDEKLKELKPVYDEARRRKSEDYNSAHAEELELYRQLNGKKNAVTNWKKQLKVNPTEEAMSEIRRLRNEAIDLINHE